MSTFLMPPRPEGSVEEQLQRQYAYLFQMAQQLNLAAQQVSGEAAPSAAAPPPTMSAP